MKNLKLIIFSFIVLSAATACKDTKKENETVNETEVEEIEGVETTQKKLSMTL